MGKYGQFYGQISTINNSQSFSMRDNFLGLQGDATASASAFANADANADAVNLDSVDEYEPLHRARARARAFPRDAR